MADNKPQQLESAEEINEPKMVENKDNDMKVETREADADVAPTQSISFSCDLCNMSFVSLPQLEAHKSTHVEEKSNVCDICDNTDASLSNLRLNNDSLFCGICKERFESLFSLYEHKITHSETAFTCDICSRSFPIAIHLEKHRISTHFQKFGFQI